MKKTKKIIFILIMLIIIGGIIFICIKNKDKKQTAIGEGLEYTPQEEISDTQMRQTSINLYYLNSSTKELKSETKSVDAKLLIENPYKKIVELLIEGPKSEGLTNVFPENAKILDAKIENNCVTLNFSEEISNFKDDVQKYNIINSILNSLSQLNEVNSVKILVNNKEDKNFNEEYKAIY